MKKTLLLAITVLMLTAGMVQAVIYSYGAALTTLSYEGQGLLLKGNPTLYVEGGSVQINSLGTFPEYDDALIIQGKPKIMLPEINIVGYLTVKGSHSHFWEMLDTANNGEQAVVTTGVYPIEDPYKALDEPVYQGLPDLCPYDPNTGEISPLVITEGEWVLNPGYYSAGIVVEDANAILLPGIYHLGGGADATGGLILKEGAVVNANEVMFHIFGTGEVSVQRNAILNATRYGLDPYKNFIFFQSRENTNKAVFKGTVNCIGPLDSRPDVLYFPANDVEITGKVLCEQFISNTAKLSGKGELIIDFRGIPGK